MPRRYLVITPVGTPDSAHKQWLDPARDFDLFLVNYGDTPGLFREDADRYFEIPGFKLQIVAQAIRESLEDVRRYSAVWLPDDDLGISATEVMRLFRIFEEHDLDLAQPAVANEYFNHVVTHRQPGCRIRFVNFVEMMCPLFRTEVLLDELPGFTLNHSGMGINYLWSQNTLERRPPGDPLHHRNLAIIDEVSVIHRRKQSRSGPYYQKLAAMGVDPDQENTRLLADYDLSHVRRHYETYSTIHSRPFGALVAALHRARTGSLRELRTARRRGFRKHGRERAAELKESVGSRIAPCASPVIVCGMHRSGTTLLVRILEQLGVFLGEDLEPNSESKTFQELNQWLLGLGHAHWDYPRPFSRLDQPRVVSRELQRRLHKRIARFVGWSRGFSSLRGVPFPWGWKDPCNTITLPLWLRLYPGARVVFVVRNGVDTALSLAERESATSERFAALIRRNPRPGHSVRCRDVEESFALWETYSEIFETRSAPAIPETAQLLRLRYEELVEDPAETIARLARFVDLPELPPASLREPIDPTRAHAQRRSASDGQRLDEMHASAWMKHYGYMPSEGSVGGRPSTTTP